MRPAARAHILQDGNILPDFRYLKPTAWRALLLWLCAITAILAIADILDATGAGNQPWYGRKGYVPRPDGPFTFVLTSVAPGSPAERAGLRPGDRFDIRSISLIERYRVVFPALNGSPQVLPIRRGTQQMRMTVVPEAPRLWQRWDLLLVPLGSLWLLLFAALIAWRRAFAPGNLLLAFVLATVAIGEVFDPNRLAVPWVWPYATLYIFGQTAGTLAAALSATFAGSFAQPLSRLRQSTQWLCYGFVAIEVSIVLIGQVGLHTLRFDPLGPLFQVSLWALPSNVVLLLVLVSSGLAIAASRGVDRWRAVWSLVPLAVFWLISFVPSYVSFSFAQAQVFNSTFGLITIALPVVLTYAALSRRFIDIGFALNRAAVFGIISTIVVGAFVLVEWAASEWLVNASHTTSAIIGAAVALALGLSMRYIHKYVDAFVDRVFFRKRYDDEAALRTFAHEAAFITNRSILLDRAAQEVRDHTNADGASILLFDDSASYDENDPAIVAMRAWHKPVDLHTQPNSKLQGELAFPMVSRGQLVGVLICGAKRDGESYAPDESEALRALAHGVGTALDTLSTRTDTSVESLRDALTQVVEELRALPGKLRSERAQ